MWFLNMPEALKLAYLVYVLSLHALPMCIVAQFSSLMFATYQKDTPEGGG